MGIKYKSSGKQVKRIGFDNFYYGVIDDCFPDHDNCYWTEQLMIMNHIKDPLCLNRHYVNPWTKNRKWSVVGWSWELKQSTKDKMAAAKLGKPKTLEHRLNIAKSRIGKKFPRENQSKDV